MENSHTTLRNNIFMLWSAICQYFSSERKNVSKIWFNGQNNRNIFWKFKFTFRCLSIIDLLEWISQTATFLWSCYDQCWLDFSMHAQCCLQQNAGDNNNIDVVASFIISSNNALLPRAMNKISAQQKQSTGVKKSPVSGTCFEQSIQYSNHIFQK